jgi:CO/xanthine dehydrogenase FAD-binding subunit
MTLAYHRPKSLDEALQVLGREPSLSLLAGGTDVYPAQTGRAAWGSGAPHALLDLSRVAALRGISDMPDRWRIGAMTTWTDIVTAHKLPPLFDGLKAAAREIGGIQIQNRGTIAGNICTASPAGDSLPCLLALDAEVRLASAAEDRVVPLADFLTGYRRTALRPGELVVAIDIPKRPGRGHFLKLGARRYLVISIVMVAGTFDIDASSGIVRSARVAVGACSAVAQRLPRLEARLTGARIGNVLPVADDLAHLAPIDDVRATGAYRRAAALQLVADLIAAAAERRAA